MRNNIVLQREIEQSILNNKDIFMRRAKEILPFAVCRDRLVSKLCMLKVFTYEDLFEFVIVKSGLSSDAFPKSYSIRLKILTDYIETDSSELVKCSTLLCTMKTIDPEKDLSFLENPDEQGNSSIKKRFDLWYNILIANANKALTNREYDYFMRSIMSGSYIGESSSLQSLEDVNNHQRWLKSESLKKLRKRRIEILKEIAESFDEINTMTVLKTFFTCINDEPFLFEKLNEIVFTSRELDKITEAYNLVYHRNVKPMNKKGFEHVEMYRRLSSHFPEHLLIVEEDGYYVGREHTAEVLESVLGNRLKKIGGSNNIAVGTPILEKIEKALKEHGDKYVVVIGNEVKKVFVSDNKTIITHSTVDEIFDNDKQQPNETIITTEEKLDFVNNLIDGINPTTGEVLEEDHLVNDKTVKILLNDLVEYYTKKMVKTKRLRVRHGEKWTDEEDSLLLAEFADKIPIREIAKLHGRSNGAIKSRIEKLTETVIEDY